MVMLMYGRIGNDSSSKTTESTNNTTHTYTIVYTGTNIEVYLDSELKGILSRNEDLSHYHSI